MTLRGVTIGVLAALAAANGAWAQVSTQTLLPNAAGGSNAWDKQGDAGVTFIDNDTNTQANSWRSNTSAQLMHVDVADWSLPANNAILKVRVTVRAQTAGNEQIDIGLDNNGSTSDAGQFSSNGTGNISISAAPTWTEYWEEWNAAPGGAWSPNNLRVRVLHNNSGGANYNYVTKCWITIYYADASAGYALIRVKQDGTGDSTTVQGGIDLTQGTLTTPNVVEIQDSNTYAERVDITSRTTSFSNTLTLRAQSGQTPIITGSASRLYGVNVDTVNYVTLSGLRVTNAAGSNSAAVRFNAADNFTVSSCNIYTSEDADLALWNGSDNGTVTGCRIYDSNGTVYGGIDIALTSACTNITIRNSMIYECDGPGIFVNAQTGNTGLAISNNAFHNNSTAITTASTTNTNVYVGNIAAAGIAFSNNIFRATNEDADQTFIYVDGAGGDVSSSSNYNDYSQTDGTRFGIAGFYKSFSQWKTDTSADGVSIESSPQFVDDATGTLASRDYHLRSHFGTPTSSAESWTRYADHSPCIDAGDPAGTYSTEREDNGNRIDQGAYGNTDEASLSGVRVVGANNDALTTWTGNASTTAWSNASNWSGFIPGSTSRFYPGQGGGAPSSPAVYIADRSSDPTLDVTVTIGSLTVDDWANNSPSVSAAALTMSASGYTLTTTGITVDSGTSVTWSAGNVTCSGNISNSGTFTTTGNTGTLTMNGSGAQSIGGIATLNVGDLTDSNTSTLTLGSMTVNVSDDLTKSGSGTLTLTSGTLSVGGDFALNAGSIAHNNGTVVLNGTADQSFTPRNSTFYNLTVNNSGSGAVASIPSGLGSNGNLTVANSLVVTAGELDLGSGYTHALNGTNDTTSIQVNGGTLDLGTCTVTAAARINTASGTTLRMVGACDLKLDADGASIAGTLYALASGTRPKIERAVATEAGRFAFSVTGEVNLFGMDFDGPDANGLTLGAASTITRIDDVEFTNGIQGPENTPSSGTTYLRILRTSGTYTLRLNKFDRYCGYNVSVPSSSTISVLMENAGGAKGDRDTSDTPGGSSYPWSGEGRDNDPDGDIHITWKYFKRWIGSVNSLWSLGANWQGGTAPSDASPEDILIGPGNPYDPLLDKNSTVRDLTIDNGGTINLGTGSYTFTITGNNFRALGGTITPGNSTVVFAGAANQIVNVGINPLYNVSLQKPGGTVQLAANLTVNNDFTLVDGTFEFDGYAMTVAGTTTFNSDSDGDGTVTMASTSALTSTGALTMNSGAPWTMSGTSVWTLGTSSTVAGTLTMTGSAEIDAGSGGGPDTLTVSGTLSMSDTTRIECLGGVGAVSVSGTFQTSGSSTSRPTVTRSSTGGFAFTIAAGATVDVYHLNFSNADDNGFNIASTATITRLDYITFANDTARSRMLQIARNVGSATSFVAEGHSFDNSATDYVRLNNAGAGVYTLYMSGFSESTVRTEANREDEANAQSVISWVNQKVWAGYWQYRRGITVTNSNGSTALPLGAPVELTFNHSTLVGAGTSLASGDDIRVVYINPSTGAAQEIDRVIIDLNHANDWGETNTTIVFPTAAQIAAGGNSDVGGQKVYWVYYGNPDAGSPPASQSAAGVVFFDGFESGNLTTGGWTTSGDMTGAFALDVSSGTYAGGVRFTAGGLQNQSITQSGFNLSSLSNVYVYYARRLIEGASGNDTFTADYYNGSWNTFTGEGITYGNVAITSKVFSLASNVTGIRFAMDAGAFVALDDGIRMDDVRIYANHNGTLPTASSFDSAGVETITGLWSDAFNWSPPGVPTSNSNVLINGNYTRAPNVDSSFAGTILSLNVTNTTPGNMIQNRSLTVTRDVSISGGTVNCNGQALAIGGNLTRSGSAVLTTGSNTITFNGGVTQTVSGGFTAATSSALNNVTISAGGSATTVLLDGDVDVGGATTVNASQFLEVASGRILKMTAGNMTANGTLQLDGTAALRLSSTTTVTVGAAGTVRTSATSSSSRATITSLDDTGATAGFAFAVTGLVNMSYYNFRRCGTGGLALNGSGAITSLSYGNFDYPANSGSFLDFTGYTYGSAQTIAGCSFKNTGGGATSPYNASGGASHGIVTFTDAVGGLAGEAFDNPTNDGKILWDPDPTAVPQIASDPNDPQADDNSGGGAGIQSGDRVIIKFTEATNGYDVTGNINTTLTISGKTNPWGTIASATWSTTTRTNDTLTIVLGIPAGGGNSVAVGDNIQIAAGTIRNAAETINANNSGNVLLDGSFGTNTPHLISAVASENGAAPDGGEAGPGSGDTVVLKFDAATNAYVITGSSIDSVLVLDGGVRSWGVITSAVWSTTTYSNDTLTVTFTSAAAAPIRVGSSISIASGTIKDDTGTNGATGSPPTVSGTFGKIQIVSVVASDPAPSTAGLGAGDVIRVTFDQPTNQGITAGNVASVLALTGTIPASPTWGTATFTVSWVNSTTVDITFSTVGTASMSPSGDGGNTKFYEVASQVILKDSSGNYSLDPKAAGSAVAMTGSLGTLAAPVIQTVIAEDTSGGGAGAQAGDRIVFTFNIDTNQPAITTASLSADLPVDGCSSWGTITSVTWADAHTLVIVLAGSGTNIVSGTSTVTSDANSKVKASGAGGGDPSSTGWPIVINGAQMATLVTISGTIYSDDVSTIISSSGTVAVSHDGCSPSSVSYTGGVGTYSVQIAAGAGDILLVYLDNGGGATGATLTFAAGGNLTVNVYQNFLRVRNDNDATAVTNADLGSGDTGDSDVPYNVSGGNLTVDSGITLRDEDDFTPGGTITTQGTGGLKVTAGTFTHGAFTHTITGNFTLAGGGIVMNAASNILDVNGNVTISAASWASTVSDGTIRVAGNWTDSAGVWTPTGGTVRLDGANPANWATYVVISEVLIDSSGAESDYEFVELYNPTPNAVDLGDWTIQYKTASGGSYTTVSTIPAGATIPAYGYYLVGGSLVSPAPDFVDTSMGFAAAGGHVRIRDSSTTVIDTLGYGTGDSPETTAEPAPATDGTLERAGSGGVGNGIDTNNNSNDFTARVSEDAQNSASAIEGPAGAYQTIAGAPGSNYFRALEVNKASGRATSTAGFDVRGNMTQASDGIFSATAGTVSFIGAGDSTINRSGAGTLSFYNLTVSKDTNSQTVATAGSTIAAAGTLTVATGILDVMNMPASSHSMTAGAYSQTGGVLKISEDQASGWEDSTTYAHLYVTGNFTASGGTVSTAGAVNGSEAEINVSGNVDLSGSWKYQGLLRCRGASSGTVTQTIKMTSSEAVRILRMDNLGAGSNLTVQLDSATSAVVTVEHVINSGGILRVPASTTLNVQDIAGTGFGTSGNRLGFLMFENSGSSASNRVIRLDGGTINCTRVGHANLSDDTAVSSRSGRFEITSSGGSITTTHFLMRYSGASNVSGVKLQGGAINVGGNWYVDNGGSGTAPTFSATGGTVTLTASAAPTITHSPSAEDVASEGTGFYNLSIDDSSDPGTVNFAPTTNLAVKNTLTLTDGRLVVGNGQSLTLGTDGAADTHTVASGGVLDLNHSGAGTATLTLERGDTLSVSGSLDAKRESPAPGDTSSAAFVASGSSGTATISVASGGQAWVRYFTASGSGSFAVQDGGRLVDLSESLGATNCDWSLDLSAVTGLWRSRIPYTLNNVTFDGATSVIGGMRSPQVWILGGSGGSLESDGADRVVWMTGAFRRMTSDTASDASYDTLTAALEANTGTSRRFRVAPGVILNDAVDVTAFTIPAGGHILENAVFAPVETNSGKRLAWDGNGTNNCKFRNTIFNRGGVDNATLENCVVFRTGAGLTALECTNCGAVSNCIVESGATTTGTTTGGDDVTAWTLASNGFVAPGWMDFHIKSGTAAVDVGSAIGGGYAVDMDGNPRPSGANWDAGVDEFYSNAAPTVIPNQMGDMAATWGIGTGRPGVPAGDQAMYVLTRGGAAGGSASDNLLMVVDMNTMAEIARFVAPGAIVQMGFYFASSAAASWEVRLFLLVDSDNDGFAEGIVEVVDTGGTGTFTYTADFVGTENGTMAAGDLHTTNNATYGSDPGGDWYKDSPRSMYVNRWFDQDGSSDGDGVRLLPDASGRMAYLRIGAGMDDGTENGNGGARDNAVDEKRLLVVSDPSPDGGADATLYCVNADPMDNGTTGQGSTNTMFGQYFWSNNTTNTGAPWEWRGQTVRVIGGSEWLLVPVSNDGSGYRSFARIAWKSNSNPTPSATWQGTDTDGVAGDPVDPVPQTRFGVSVDVFTMNGNPVISQSNTNSSRRHLLGSSTNESIWTYPSSPATSPVNVVPPLYLSGLQFLYAGIGDDVHKVELSTGLGSVLFDGSSTITTPFNYISHNLAWGTAQGHCYIARTETHEAASTATEAVSVGQDYVPLAGATAFATSGTANFGAVNGNPPTAGDPFTYANGTTSTGAVAAGAATIPVADTAIFTAAGGYGWIEADNFKYTGKSVASGPGNLTGVTLVSAAHAGGVAVTRLGISGSTTTVAVSAGAATIPVADTSRFTATGGSGWIEDDTFNYTAVDVPGSQLTGVTLVSVNHVSGVGVTRPGLNGVSGIDSAHSAGVSVYGPMSAAHVTEEVPRNGFPYVIPGHRIREVRLLQIGANWYFVFTTDGGLAYRFQVPP